MQLQVLKEQWIIQHEQEFEKAKKFGFSFLSTSMPLIEI
jgi:hypothetical protein